MEETVLRRTGSHLRLPLLGPTEGSCELPLADCGSSDAGGSPGPPSPALVGASLRHTVINVLNIYVVSLQWVHGGGREKGFVGAWPEIERSNFVQ